MTCENYYSMIKFEVGVDTGDIMHGSLVRTRAPCLLAATQHIHT